MRGSATYIRKSFVGGITYHLVGVQSIVSVMTKLANVEHLIYMFFMLIVIVIGMHVSNATFNAIAMRYSNENGHVLFNDFVAAYIKLKLLFGKKLCIHSNV